MARQLGELESRLLAYVQMRKLRQVRVGELAGPLLLSAVQERELLRRMARAKMITRVWRGLYLVPPRLPLGGVWGPDPITALNALIEARGGRYQICGPNAFNRYGFDEQIPIRLYAYNNRLSGDRTIGTLGLTLIKVADGRLGGTEKLTTAQGRAVYSSRARSLVDAVYDWSRFDGIPRAYGWIEQELKAKRVSAAELVAMTIRYGNQGTIRRIGALLEKLAAPRGLMRRLHGKLKRSTSLIAWNPARPKRGKINRRWGVIENG